MKSSRGLWQNFELKIVLLILFITLSVALSAYLLFYDQYQKLTINDLKADAEVIYQYVDEILDSASFTELNTQADEVKQVYINAQQQLQQIRRIANIRYLYTAKRTADGSYIYVIDGLDPLEEDFYHIGTPIEEEIVTELSKCLEDQAVMGDRILVTEWGIVFVTYFPVHDDAGAVIGAVGMEFDCEGLYNAFTRVQIYTIVISLVIVALFSMLAVLILKRVVFATESELQKKDELLIKAKEEALENSRAKSDFLSRMSHEIRTPMNAIIGMTKIAQNTTDISKLKYCLDTINTSSNQLLGLINDVLDMSKIEAGKFELENAPLNVEKILMKVCNLIIDRIEQKNQKLDIIIDNSMRMHYSGDELRLTQILTNLLSNAVKFTPEKGIISLFVCEQYQTDDGGLLRFTVADTGIGMTQEQIARLFNSFAQADESITRRFGGTGLGLAITKSIIDKMNGRIWVESELGKGSKFVFEIPLKRLNTFDETVIFSGITPSDLRLLVVDADEATREHFGKVTEKFGISTDSAETGKRAIGLVREAGETKKPYDVIFLDYALPDMNGVEVAQKIAGMIDKNTVIIMTSFLEWHRIEKAAMDIGVDRFMPKPLFPSSILDAINDVIGSTIKKLEIEAERDKDLPNFSNLSILLTEDVDINREIFIALLEDTHITIDIAENGKIAVDKFSAAPEKYDMIVMDIQMPVMDGYEATRLIRAMQNPRARQIPIIAMTANAFVEDVNKCLDSGMNDHLSKPIDLNSLIQKIKTYTANKKL